MQVTADDVALLWFNSTVQYANKAEQAAKDLWANADKLNIQKICYASSSSNPSHPYTVLSSSTNRTLVNRTPTNQSSGEDCVPGLTFNSPLDDSRAPGIIIQVKPALGNSTYGAGTIYTAKRSKIAEHGSFSDADRHVGLVVYLPGLQHRVDVSDLVYTGQVAPTVLSLLGLDPNELQAVKQEGIKPLLLPEM